MKNVILTRSGTIKGWAMKNRQILVEYLPNAIFNDKQKTPPQTEYPVLLF